MCRSARCQAKSAHQGRLLTALRRSSHCRRKSSRCRGVRAVPSCNADLSKDTQCSTRLWQYTYLRTSTCAKRPMGRCGEIASARRTAPARECGAGLRADDADPRESFTRLELSDGACGQRAEVTRLRNSEIRLQFPHVRSGNPLCERAQNLRTDTADGRSGLAGARGKFAIGTAAPDLRAGGALFCVHSASDG